MFKWESLLVTSKGGREGTLRMWRLKAFFFFKRRKIFGFLSLAGVYSSHESSSSHESGSSQVPKFFFQVLFFFDYTNDVRAVTRNINFPVGDIFPSRSKEP